MDPVLADALRAATVLALAGASYLGGRHRGKANGNGKHPPSQRKECAEQLRGHERWLSSHDKMLSEHFEQEARTNVQVASQIGRLAGAIEVINRRNGGTT